MELATFGAGCFWGVEQAFRCVEGVQDTAVGYAGGKTEDATYEDVCGGRTGHAEVCQVTFDPAIVPYEKLVKIFWSIHDPTTPNRQGPDMGTQYRSIILTHSDEQAEAAVRLREEARPLFPRRIVTEIEPIVKFIRAEEYHQRYHDKNGGGACHVKL